jgi:hypothetical protein
MNGHVPSLAFPNGEFRMTTSMTTLTHGANASRGHHYQVDDDSRN